MNFAEAAQRHMKNPLGPRIDRDLSSLWRRLNQVLDLPVSRERDLEEAKIHEELASTLKLRAEFRLATEGKNDEMRNSR